MWTTRILSCTENLNDVEIELHLEVQWNLEPHPATFLEIQLPTITRMSWTYCHPLFTTFRLLPIAFYHTRLSLWVRDPCPSLDRSSSRVTLFQDQLSWIHTSLQLYISSSAIIVASKAAGLPGPARCQEKLLTTRVKYQAEISAQHAL